jgi:hypothetical protein
MIAAMFVSPHTTGRAAAAAAPSRQEAVMGQAIPRQHPAVVLRSHYNHLRALLAVAMIAVVGLTVAVVILAGDGDQVSGTSVARPIESLNYGDFPATGRPDSTGTRYDGGPGEGSRGVVPAQQPDVRYDGGPEEGSRGALSYDQASNAVAGTRYDGGPEEGSRGSGH